MKREEAIEIIRDTYHTDIELQALEVLIPELQESEDERMVRAIEYILYENYSDTAIIEGVEIAEIVAWLEKQKDIEDRWIEDREQCFWNGVEEGKMLAEKQKEQKPAEWSEEDEKYLNRVITLWVNDFGEDSDTVKWLKSLRPSWKPSEEQMEALNALNLHGDLSYVGQQNQLISLYNNLKKLM